MEKKSYEDLEKINRDMEKSYRELDLKFSQTVEENTELFLKIDELHEDYWLKLYNLREAMRGVLEACGMETHRAMFLVNEVEKVQRGKMPRQ